MGADRRLNRPRALDAPLPARWGRWQRTKNTLVYGLVRAAFFLVRLVPYPLALVMATLLARLGWWTAWRERRRALANLAAAFPNETERERRRIARATFLHLGRCAAEVTHLSRFLDGPHAITLDAASRSVLDGCLARGKGLVAATGHIGNWELMAQVVARAGYDVTAIAKPLYDPRLTRWVHEQRSASGLSLIWRGDDSGAKEMLRVFKRGGILALLIDQDTRVPGEFVPFFGRLAHTPSAAAALALRTGAPAVVGWMHRIDERHRMCFEEVPHPALDDRDAAVRELTARLTAGLEAAIRCAPEQWVWLHDRWKRQPAADGR